MLYVIHTVLIDPPPRPRAPLAPTRASSDLCAASERAQTALPEREGPPLDHHFAAFVRSRPWGWWLVMGKKTADDYSD